MVWSNYKYLLPVLALSCVCFYSMYRNYASLAAPSKKRTAKEIAFLGVLCLLGLVAIYWKLFRQRNGFCFGPGDTGTDTIEQYVPFYTNLVENIKDGTFDVWTFEYGLGVNLPSYQTWLFDPFNLIVVPFSLMFGVGHLSLALVVAQSARVLLSAYLMDHLLTRFCEIPLARIVGSVLFAFCSYLILLGQNFFLGSMLPMLAAVILCFELYLETQTPRTFLCVTFSVAILLLWSPYIAFMVLLFTAIYLLVRIFAVLGDAPAKIYVATIGKLFLPVICGAFLSCVLFIPYAHFLLQETSRTASGDSSVNGVTSLFGFVNLDWVPAIFSRMLGSSLLNNGSSTAPVVTDLGSVSYEGSFPFEFIQLGFSCGALVLLSQFIDWALNECDKRTRRLIVVSAILVALLCFNRFLPTLFTAMVRFQYRCSGVLAVPLCIAMAVAIEKRIIPGKVAPIPLAISVVVSLAVLTWSLMHAVTGRLPSVVFAALLIAAVAALSAAHARSSVSGPLTLAFLAALVASSFFDGFYCTNNRNLLPIESFPHSFASPDDVDTEAALAHVRNADSDMFRIDKTYCDHFLASDSWIEHYQGVSAYNSTMDADVWEFIDKLWPEAKCSWAVYTEMFMNDPSPEQSVLNLLGLRYVFSYGAIDLDWAEPVYQEGSLNVYRVKGSDGFASVRGKAVSESDADTLRDAPARRELLKDFVIVPDDVALKISAGLSASPQSVSFQKISEHELAGAIEADGDAVVCVPVPNTGTWEVTVDGQRVDTFRADYGFVGFEVPAGSHGVAISYRTEGRGLGIGLSLVGVVLTSVIAAAFGISAQKKKGIR